VHLAARRLRAKHAMRDRRGIDFGDVELARAAAFNAEPSGRSSTLAPMRLRFGEGGDAVAFLYSKFRGIANFNSLLGIGAESREHGSSSIKRGTRSAGNTPPLSCDLTARSPQFAMQLAEFNTVTDAPI